MYRHSIDFNIHMLNTITARTSPLYWWREPHPNPNPFLNPDAKHNWDPNPNVTSDRNTTVTLKLWRGTSGNVTT